MSTDVNNFPMNPVDFHGDTIFCVDYNGEPYTPVKPIVENLGLSWGTQGPKLSENRSRFNCLDMKIVAKDGKVREMLCLPVRKLTAFLYSINPDKVKEEVRPKLVQYQEECDEVLWQYWSTGRATKESVAEASAPQEVSVERLRALREFYTVDCGATGTQATRAIDRAWKRIEGISPLAIGGILLHNEPEDDLLNYKTVTDIAKMFGAKAGELNTFLTDHGLQTAEKRYRKVKNKETGKLENKSAGYDYQPTPLGYQHGAKRVSDSAAHDVNKEVWNTKWHKDKLPAYLREVGFKSADENASTEE